MPSTRLNRAVAIAALASTTAAFTGAQAAIYTGSWDPAYGQPFPNLGWRGTATYSIPDACLALGDGTIANSNACSNGSFSVLSAQVNFYDLATPAVTLETLTYGSMPISSITLANHSLAGVFTSYSPVALARSGVAGGGNYLFALKFDGASATLAWTTELDTGKPVYHLGSTPPPPVAFTLVPVPEPATLAMLASGLAVVGLAGKRRRRS